MTSETPTPNFAVLSAAATHVGNVRKLNEDALLDRPDLGLWVVADGMGGHDSGEVASGLIIELLDRIPAPSDGLGFIAEVRTRLGEANRRLLEESRRRGADTVIGSTVVAFLSFGAFFACLWAGDSRLYRLRGGVLKQVTRDHSQVQEMVDAGMLAPEAAERHPYANVITRAVGTSEDLELDKVSDRLAADDLFLLCSDGLSKMVAEDEIAGILRQTPLEAIPQALIAAALERGGKDNVTVVAIRIGAPLE
jgi:serine/threonine-protein phosphatase Stp1